MQDGCEKKKYLLSYIHTSTHIPTYARYMHAYTHTNMYRLYNAHIHTRLCKHELARTFTHSQNPHMHSYLHTRTYIHAYVHTCTDYIVRTHTRSCKHGHTHTFTLMMKAVRTFETSVYSNETTRRYIPEGYNFKLTLIILCR
jgi:hypothetical protein